LSFFFMAAPSNRNPDHLIGALGVATQISTISGTTPE